MPGQNNATFPRGRGKGLPCAHYNEIEPCHEKTCIWGFRTVPTETWKMASLKIWIKEVEGSIDVAKTKELISRAVTSQLICAFVFAYVKSSFSHNVAHIAPPISLGLLL